MVEHGKGVDIGRHQCRALLPDLGDPHQSADVTSQQGGFITSMFTDIVI